MSLQYIWTGVVAWSLPNCALAFTPPGLAVKADFTASPNGAPVELVGFTCDELDVLAVKVTVSFPLGNAFKTTSKVWAAVCFI